MLTGKKEVSIVDKFHLISNELHQAVRRHYRAGQIRPLYALTFLTYRCTSQCRACNIWKREPADEKKEMGIDGWKRVIDRLNRSGVTGIELFGGDALLRKDVLFDIIEYCRSKKITTSLPTNGNLLDQETARLLVDKGLDQIHFSIDGPPAVHDFIRGQEGSYSRIAAAVQKIAGYRKKAACPEIIINTTISKLNYTFLLDLLEEMKSFPIDAVKLGYLSQIPQEAVRDSAVNGHLPDPYFESTDDENHLLSKEEAGHLNKSVREIWRSRRHYPFSLNLDNLLIIPEQGLEKGVFPQSPCHRSRIEPTITPYGDILPCPFFSHYLLGNLYEEPLETIWGNPSHRDFVKAQKNGKIRICSHCNMRMFKKGLRLTIKKGLVRWLYA